MTTEITEQSPKAPARKTESPRDAWLDFFRASAILLVLIYHGVENSPVYLGGLKPFTSWGKYGVDIFFVLSGWLIGGLYWREMSRFGDVNLRLFLPRRWIRTIPPYLAALALSWLAVYKVRHEPFNFGYLIFLQNYYAHLPFFDVSWSLCIEEHFYLVLPMLLLFWKQLKIPYHFLFAALVVVAPICRMVTQPNATAVNFDYAMTATHLRMEGLILGFWLAYFPSMSPMVWTKIKSVSGVLVFPAFVALGCLPLLSDVMMYRIGLTIMAVALVTILVFFTGRKANALVGSSVIKWIALTSYSVYLTHALVIHISRMVLNRFHLTSLPTYFVVTYLLIAVCGFVFYSAAEWTSLRLRDRVAPRRGKTPAVEPLGSVHSAH